jgi:transcriptional regulator with XRE-family HTH domain
MQNKGITQYRLAIALRISQPSIASWIHGAAVPREETARMVARYFGEPEANILKLVHAEKAERAAFHTEQVTVEGNNGIMAEIATYLSQIGELPAEDKQAIADVLRMLVSKRRGRAA